MNKIFAYFDVEQMCFLAISASVETVLGYTPEEMEGGNYIRFLMYQGDVERGEVAVTGNKNEGKTVTGFVNSYRHKNGHEVYLSWTASIIEDDITYCIADLATPEQIALHQKLRHEKENQTQSIEGQK